MKTDKKEEMENRVERKYEEYEALFCDYDTETNDINGKIAEVQSLIEHVNQRIQYTETRITRTTTFSITLFGIGMAFFAVSSRLEGLPFYLSLVTTALFIITGSITAIIHTLQVNPKYPFRALENDWKWFYPRIIDDKYRPTPYVKETEQKYLEKRLLHIEGMKKYAKHILEEDQIERLKIDIQQLYLLHVNEKYKNAFLSTLRNTLFWGVSLTTISIIALFVIIVVEKLWPLSIICFFNRMMNLFCFY